MALLEPWVYIPTRLKDWTLVTCTVTELLLQLGGIPTSGIMTLDFR